MPRLISWPCLAVAVLAACSSGTKGPGVPANPPVVTVSVPLGSVVGRRIPLQLTVSGCDAVAKLELFDGEVKLQDVAFAGSPSSIEVDANLVPYNRGIAATPAFVARAFCSDGRVGTSAPAPAKFFPVEENVQASGGVQTVPDAFVAHGSGADTRFLGCGRTEQGTPALFVVTPGGFVERTFVPSQYTCTSALVITGRNPVSGTRWAMEPGQWVIEFDDAFDTILTSVSPPVKVQWISVGPEGDAVIFVGGIAGSGRGLKRLRSRSGESAVPVWSYGHDAQHNLGDVVSNIVVDPSGAVVVATWGFPEPANPIVAAQRFDYRTGAPAASYSLWTFPGWTSPPQVRLSESGANAYFAYPTGGNTQSVVRACATTVPGCSGASSGGQPAGKRWESVVDGVVAVAEPYADDSRVAAISATHATFLDAYAGTKIGPAVIRPTGALNFLGYQPGRGREFYLLSGSGSFTEIVAVENAETGEAYRYDLPNGSLTVAVADDGRAWLRIGTALVRPYPLMEYRLGKSSL